jgi:purine-nucleoside phosphorylase
VEDHLNFAGTSPLMGLLEDVPGPRFPDMTEPYAHTWRKRALEIGQEAGFPCGEGVLAFVSGPSLPTRAEYRFLKQAGAHLVAMSVVPEVLASVHAGLPVLALLGVIQRIDLVSPTPTSVEEMLDAAELAAPRLATILTGLIERMGGDPRTSA